MTTTVLGRNARPEAVVQLRHQLGLDQALAPRYVEWLWGFVRGDWGASSASLAMPPTMPWNCSLRATKSVSELT